MEWEAGQPHVGSAGGVSTKGGDAMGLAFCVHPGLPLAIVAASRTIASAATAAGATGTAVEADTIPLLRFLRFPRSTLLSASGQVDTSPATTAPTATGSASSDEASSTSDDDLAVSSTVLKACLGDSPSALAQQVKPVSVVIDASAAAAGAAMTAIGKDVGRGGIAVWALLRSMQAGTEAGVGVVGDPG